MTTTVHKETFHFNNIGIDGTVRLMLPVGAEILTVAEQFPGSGSMQVWHRCCPENSKVERAIHVVGTGNPAPNKSKARYLSTVILHSGALVLHFFDDGRLL